MDVRQCKTCNRLFQYMGKPYCPECMDEMDRMFIKVRDYLYDHPDADIPEISGKTDVKEKVILDFLKDERLSLQNASGMLICEQCGKAIEAGRMCRECKERLSNAFSRMVDPPKANNESMRRNDLESKRKGSRMHLEF